MLTKQSTVRIGVKPATNILHGIRFAAERGRPINSMVTINFTDLGIPDDMAGSVFRDIRARVRRWWTYERETLGRNLGTLDDLAVHAHPPGGRRHVHWLLHVPPGVKSEWAAVVRDRLCKVVGTKQIGCAIEFTEVGAAGSLGKYILRGVDPAYAKYFHMWSSDEGRVVGRRSHVSRSISNAGRRTAGWKRRRRLR